LGETAKTAANEAGSTIQGAAIEAGKKVAGAAAETYRQGVRASEYVSRNTAGQPLIAPCPPEPSDMQSPICCIHPTAETSAAGRYGRQRHRTVL